jgi:type I restriction enzyme S subunit
MASSLADIAEIIMGQSPKSETCNFEGRGLPLLNGPTEFGPHHPTPVQFTTDTRKSALPGDLLFCVRGSTTGRMNWADREYAIGRGIAAIRHKEDRELQPFVRAVIELGLLDLLAQATGSTFPNVSVLQLAGLPTPSLDSDDQRAVAHVLGTFDEKVEMNRRMNETLEAMAGALFKSWFVDFDPVRAKAEGRNTRLPKAISSLFPDSFEDFELGKIPIGWRATTLGAETERHGGRIQTGPFGSQLHASDYSVDGVPVVMPQDISNRRVSTARIARIKESDAERLSKHCLQTGDIIYSRRGDVERHAQISTRETGWLCGTGCLLVRMGPRWPSSMFMSLALDRPESRAWIAQHAIGATMPNLNTGILSAVPLVVPPEKILRVFSRLVGPIEQLISARNAESYTITLLRDSLLPKLISGDLRIPDAEKLVEARV